jgi:uncharacterized protein (TIGR00369 family)
VTNAYPPDQHLLRDLRLSFAHDEVGVASRAWLPVVPEICTDAGFARAGALATLVDVIGGGLAAAAAHPNWIATADLTLHTVAGAASGATVEARGRTLRAGRTTVVLEVGLSDDTGRELGLATMSFSVLPRRDANPDILEVATPGRTTMAAPDSGLSCSIADMLEVRVIDAAAGAIELPVTDWARNSMGALQGGVVALVADLAAEQALRAASGRAVTVADLHLVYLGFGRVGPIRTRVDVLASDTARVEIIDSGAEDRRMTIASVVAP